MEGSQRVLLGETQEYEPLCRDCYQKAIAAEKARKEEEKAGEWEKSSE